MLDDKELVERLQRLSGPELLDAIAIATGGKTIEQKQQEAADAVKAYIAKGNSMADYQGCALNEAALELDRQREAKEER